MGSSRPPSEIDCTEGSGSPNFPYSRFGEVAYWTETRDLALAARAARNGGVVTTSDLHTCGFSKPAITAAKRRGVLTSWGRGVWLVGPLTDEVTEARAAMLAVPHGTLGFDAAAQLARFGPIAKPPLDVIVAPDKHGERSGVQIHRIELTCRDLQRFEGLPCTSPAVTLVHLARVLQPIPTSEPSRRPSPSASRTRSSSSRPSIATAAAAARRACAACSSSASRSTATPPTAPRWAHDRDHRKEQFLLAHGLTPRRFTALQAIDEPALVIAGIAAALALALAQKR